MLFVLAGPVFGTPLVIGSREDGSSGPAVFARARLVVAPTCNGAGQASALLPPMGQPSLQAPSAVQTQAY